MINNEVFELNNIDKSSRVPLYSQLMDILIEKITNSLSENDQLSSEREICDTYDLSRSTVRQAMVELQKEGYIYKVHGKGTFVAPKKLNQDLMQFYSFTEEMKKIGKEPKSVVLDCEVIEADESLAEKMKIEEKKGLYKITRLRKADDTPMLYEVTYLPLNRFPGLTKEDLESRAMYDIFKNKFAVDIFMAEEYFQPVLTNKLESKYLEIPEGAPSLKIERLSFELDKIIEYTISVARGDKFKYKVRLLNK